MERTKHQVEVVVFSHGGDIPTDLILKVAENANLTRKRADSVAEIQGKVGIAHPTDDREWEQVVSGAKHGDVRVRMSTEGLASSEDPVCREGVFVFHLVPPPVRVSEDEWLIILKGLSNDEIVSALAMGEAPSGLRRFFFQETTESLAALAILCQGYLAAHGGAHLDGWDEIPQALRNQVNTPEKQDMVRKPSWWMQAFRQSSNWKNNLTNETQALAQQNRCEPEVTAAINNLVAAFEGGGDSPAVDAADAQIVPKAYAACKSLLGGGR